MVCRSEDHTRKVKQRHVDQILQIDSTPFVKVQDSALSYNVASVRERRLILMASRQPMIAYLEVNYLDTVIEREDCRLHPCGKTKESMEIDTMSTLLQPAHGIGCPGGVILGSHLQNGHIPYPTKFVW